MGVKLIYPHGHECIFCRIGTGVWTSYNNYKPLEKVRTKRGEVIYFHKDCFVKDNIKNLKERMLLNDKTTENS